MSKVFDAINEAKRLKEWLIEQGQTDPELIADMIEGETDLFAIRDWAIRKYMDEKALAESVAERIRKLGERKASIEARGEKLRLIIAECMTATEQKTYRGPDATVTMTAQKPKLIIRDESLIPEKYWRVKREINKTAINEAHKNGETIAGTTLSNGGEVLTIRS